MRAFLRRRVLRPTCPLFYRTESNSLSPTRKRSWSFKKLKMRSHTGAFPRALRNLLISAERSKAGDNGLYGEDAIEPGCRLARGSSPQSLGTQAAGLEPEGNSSGFGRHRRSGEPVDQARARRRGRSSQEADLSRCAATLERAPAGAPQRAVGPRSFGPWISGRGVDLPEGSGSDPKRVRGCLPSGACEPTGQEVGAFFTEASTPGEPARRRGHRALETGAVA